MNMVAYDGSFEGLLTAVFEIYEYKIAEPNIVHKEQLNISLFGKVHQVESNIEKSKRVYQKLKDKLTPNGLSQLYKTYLSEEKEIENVIYRYIAYTLSHKASIENNFSHPDVLYVQQTSRKVHREKHRMEAFVRFQLSKDGLYYCLIQPDFNVLPLICNHFKNRYADQRWLIYDSRRKYGLYYDLETVEEINMHFSEDLNNKSAMLNIIDEKEELYQTLWRQYFSSVNIAARRNMKLHIQHMPKRYWRWLTEKKGSVNGEY
ncbi:MAG: DNA metabolism protein [Chitinophagaceae bacterium]|nr:MAG: DNA metabolism protein [Chitinophagaceae bacterium]